MSWSTVVSVHPLPIVTGYMPGIAGSEKQLPAAPPGGVATVAVSDCFYARYVFDGKSVAMPVTSQELAQAIVNDVNSNAVYVTEAANPAFFAIPGESLSATEVMSKYKTKVELARATQRRWFLELVKMADIVFTKSRSMAEISALDIIAANTLGLTREWVINAESVVETKYCPACRTALVRGAVVCAQCKCIIDQTEYAKLKFGA